MGAVIIIGFWLLVTAYLALIVTREDHPFYQECSHEWKEFHHFHPDDQKWNFLHCRKCGEIKKDALT